LTKHRLVGDRRAIVLGTTNEPIRTTARATQPTSCARPWSTDSATATSPAPAAMAAAHGAGPSPPGNPKPVPKTAVAITMQPRGTVSFRGRTRSSPSVIKVPALITAMLPAIAAASGTTVRQMLPSPDWEDSHALTAAFVAVTPASQIHPTSRPVSAPPSPAPAILPARGIASSWGELMACIHPRRRGPPP